MRMFYERIFMGAGQFSKLQCAALHYRLNEALSDLSGCQQPGRPETAERAAQEAEDQDRAIQNMKDIIDDIVVSLGFEIIALKEKPPVLTKDNAAGIKNLISNKKKFKYFLDDLSKINLSSYEPFKGDNKDNPALCCCWSLTMVGNTTDEYWREDEDGNPTGHHPGCEFYTKPPFIESRKYQIAERSARPL